jgi:hypothetical protein
MNIFVNYSLNTQFCNANSLGKLGFLNVGTIYYLMFNFELTIHRRVGDDLAAQRTRVVCARQVTRDSCFPQANTWCHVI